MCLSIQILKAVAFFVGDLQCSIREMENVSLSDIENMLRSVGYLGVVSLIFMDGYCRGNMLPIPQFCLLRDVL